MSIRSCAVFYFSGTGNTEMVVKRLAKELQVAGVSIEISPIEEQLRRNPAVPERHDYDLVGLAYPIYGFTTPSIVDRFAAVLPPGDNTPMFILKTGADFISINHNASAKTITGLQGNGYDVFYDRIIAMPSNWVVKYPDSLVKQLWESAERKAVHMSRELMGLKRRRYNPGRFVRWVSSGMAYMEKTHGARWFGRSLVADETCNRCGLCVRQCPAGNINLIGSEIRFASECLWCMRCLYRCPRQAITSRGMNFCVFSGGYDIDPTIADESIHSEFVTSRTRGYFKHFHRYFEDDAL